MRSKLIFIVCIAAFAAGCVTYPKPLYFTVDMTTPPGEGAGYALLEDRHVDIDAIFVSDKLVRRDVLIHLGDTEYEYYQEAKWISRVSDLVQEKLEVELMPPAGVEPEPIVLVAGRLLAFEQVDADDGVYARIKLEATLRQEGTSRYDAALERTYYYYEQVDEPGPMPKVVADKLSEGMEDIAAQIARDANTIDLNQE